VYTAASKRAVHRASHVADDYKATVTYDHPSRGAESIAAAHDDLRAAVKWTKRELQRRTRTSSGATGIVTWRALAGHQEVLWSSARSRQASRQSGGFDELVELLKAAMRSGVSGRAALVAAEIELRGEKTT
jgi:hypothetical protein